MPGQFVVVLDINSSVTHINVIEAPVFVLFFVLAFSRRKKF